MRNGKSTVFFSSFMTTSTLGVGFEGVAPIGRLLFMAPQPVVTKKKEIKNTGVRIIAKNLAGEGLANPMPTLSLKKAAL
jgi:hypothetical protein